jgi:monofunctional biosynthetic peptidoglycan transglycosylase
MRLAGLVALAFVLLQLFFATRVALAVWVDPQSTSFQRSEAWRIAADKGHLPWRQSWRDAAAISDSLKRAVIASEDAAFAQHDGVEWDAIEKAWDKNQKALQQAQRKAAGGGRSEPGSAGVASGSRPAKIVGGSTITQQLAKNWFLSGERNLVRKGQELVLTFAIEAMLDKRRILEIYLNSVEWGEGVFGAEAAAQHYFRAPAARLTPYQAARLAVMLPAPKRFESRPNSGYLADRASVIVARMQSVELP